MKNLNKSAIAKVVIRQKQYLAAIRPIGDVLSLATLLFADEIVDPAELGELPFTGAELDARQLAMAEQIIDTQSTDFKADKYHDEYRESLLKLIERKAKGMETVVQPPLEKKGGEVIDLMSALEASLEAAKKKRQSM
jgi:DNA end-binding protein Ku